MITWYEEEENGLFKEESLLKQISETDSVRKHLQQQKVSFLRQRLYIGGYSIIRKMLHEGRPMPEIREWISKLDIAAKPLLLALSWQSEDPEKALTYWDQTGMYPPKIKQRQLPEGLEERKLSSSSVDQISGMESSLVDFAQRRSTAFT
ncbi:MAG: hypothetical protein R3B47_05035 [Bacteroidia bacterium]